MSRFFTFLFVLIVLTVCVGFFRGWFTMTTGKEPLSEKIDVHFQVDKNKMQQDANTVEEKTKALLGTDKDDRLSPQ